MAVSTERADEPITGINVTPLVDICLVLVIIFMAIAPFALTAGIQVLESRAKTAEGKASASDNVQVKLDAAGVVTVNGAAVDSAALWQELLKALAKSKDKMVIVTADDTNKVGQVVGILDTARQAGALKVAIMKEAAPAPGAAQGRGG